MNTNEIQSWKSTALWNELAGRKDGLTERLRARLSIALPRVESVLDDGDTMPPTFTLHDSEHARRVADRIAEIVGPELMPKLGPYEIASLLLAAYLHDIGMTPPLAKVEGTLAYVLSADPAALTKSEQENLQGWLDDQPEGLVPPLTHGPVTAEELRRAREIVAGYVRFRHAEWSGDWIRENLADLDCNAYEGWIDDVVLLCKSHQVSPDELKAPVFDPRLVGTPSSILNLRYAACLLRIADVLEFDPERTPRILFLHRDVQKSSAIFWHKDHNLSFALKDGKISIHATSPDAVTEHAIRTINEQIDEQLLGCRRLADETSVLGSQSMDVPHTWHLETSVHAKIVPRNDAYEYVEGTFRPDPVKVLELIGGLALYGSRLASVRELLQNAFDAVRDQIARQRLLRDSPADDHLYETLAATHSVSLTLCQKADGIRLICEDSGCGMSRSIITSRFLVGGRAGSRDSRELERACQAYGFSTGRTARFGIGVLSYFLIASEIKIQTRRSIEAGDQDGTGWTFSTEGIEDFGELRRLPDAPVGTRVEMKLSPDVVGDPQEFADKLREYLASEVRHLPCPFKFETQGFSTPPIRGTQGWINRDDDVEVQLVGHLRDSRALRPADMDLLSTVDREEEEQRTEYWRNLRNAARGTLSLRCQEAELPGGLGHYRVFFGSFSISDEPSLTFMDAQCDSGNTFRFKPLETRHAFLPMGHTVMSWNGMLIGVIDNDEREALHPLEEPANVIVEIDWTSDRAGELAVHRNSFTLSEAARTAIVGIKDAIDELRDQFVQTNLKSVFGMINSRVAGIAPGAEPSLLWPDGEAEGQNLIALTELKFPVIPATFRSGRHNWEWRGAPVIQLESFSCQSGSREVPFWRGSHAGPSAIGVAETTGRQELVPIWEDFEPGRAPLPYLGYQSRFSPAWKDLVGASLENFSSGGIWVLNSQHAMIQSLDIDSWEWVRNTFVDGIDPMPYAEELVSRPGRISGWIALCLRRRQQLLWSGLAEREPGFLAQAWEILFGSKQAPSIIFRREHFYEASIEIVSPAEWQHHPDQPSGINFAERMGPPGTNWQLSHRTE